MPLKDLVEHDAVEEPTYAETEEEGGGDQPITVPLLIMAVDHGRKGAGGQMAFGVGTADLEF
jgi:hypothetical protein